MDPLARIFGSFARLKLLRLFLFNDDQGFTLSDIVTRTKTPKDAVRKELLLLAAADLIRKRKVTGGVAYSVNKKFTYFEGLKTFFRTTTNLDNATMIQALKKAGNIRLIVLSGLFTGEVETKIDLLVVGDKLDDKYLLAGVHTLEALLGRELRFASFTTEDFRYRLGVYDRLLRDIFDFSHRVIFDKIGLENLPGRKS